MVAKLFVNKYTIPALVVLGLLLVGWNMYTKIQLLEAENTQLQTEISLEKQKVESLTQAMTDLNTLVNTYNQSRTVQQQREVQAQRDIAREDVVRAKPELVTNMVKKSQVQFVQEVHCFTGGHCVEDN